MEDATHASEILDRMILALNLKNDSELSKKIGVSAQAVSKARNTGKLPVSWIPKFAHQHKISTDWLFFGCIFSTDTPVKTLKNTPLQPILDKTDTQYVELKIELEEERRERRELAAENRRLWKENGDLREQNAILRAQSRKEQEYLFDERKKITPSSNELHERP